MDEFIKLVRQFTARMKSIEKRAETDADIKFLLNRIRKLEDEVASQRRELYRARMWGTQRNM